MEFEKNYRFAVPAAEIYRAWLSPTSLVSPMHRIEVDPVVGGSFKLYSTFGDKETVMLGTFLKLENDKQITYSWHWQNTAENTVVDVAFSQSESGTDVTIKHSGFKSTQSLNQHSTGWDHYITELKKILKAKLDG